jgi:hypothetical protein
VEGVEKIVEKSKEKPGSKKKGEEPHEETNGSRSGGTVKHVKEQSETEEHVKIEEF